MSMMFSFFSGPETKKEIKDGLTWEQKARGEKMKKIREKRLENLRKARETKQLRHNLEQLEKTALIEKIIEFCKENKKLTSELKNKWH